MLETLAIVAYRQPVTRPEIDEIRGVDCGPVLKTLLERSLVRIIGKKEEVGRPILYGTTPEFLRTFSLQDLTELPTLREFHELRRTRRWPRSTRAPLPAGDAGARPMAAPPRRPPRSARPDPAEEDALLDELDRARPPRPSQAAGPPERRQTPARPTEPDADGELAYVRLQRFLAQAGVSSRRRAEALIASGRRARQRRAR